MIDELLDKVSHNLNSGSVPFGGYEQRSYHIGVLYHEWASLTLRQHLEVLILVHEGEFMDIP